MDIGNISDAPFPTMFSKVGSYRKQDKVFIFTKQRRGLQLFFPVVNEAARDAIPEELRLGLVLTIYEAKGLEFDDVLLYNFFKDSQVLLDSIHLILNVALQLFPCCSG